VFPQPGTPRTDDEGVFKPEVKPGEVRCACSARPVFAALALTPPRAQDKVLDTFALVLFEVDHVDYVNLFTNGRKQFVLDEETRTWAEQDLNP